MESLLNSALQYEQEAQMEYEEFNQPKILVVGTGGAGNNSINRLTQTGIKGADTIAINTDNQHLKTINADTKMLIGKNITRGLGSGGYPEVAERCIEIARPQLEEILKGADLVFITCGMGGGTGTGTAHVVADIARKQGAIVVGIVTKPFKVERARLLRAEEGIEKLRKKADTVIVINNEKLLEMVPHLPVDKAFGVVDQLISEVVKGITETITLPSLINLDYADVRAIMSNCGVAVMLYGESSSREPREVVNEVLRHPLLELDYTGATGALFHVTGGTNLSLKCVNEIAKGITNELNPMANIILGARIDPSFNERIRVMAIMTGVNSPNVVGPRKENGILIKNERDLENLFEMII